MVGPTIISAFCEWNLGMDSNLFSQCLVAKAILDWPRSVLTCKLELHLLLGLGGLVFAAYTQPQQQSGKRNVIPRHAHNVDPISKEQTSMVSHGNYLENTR